MFVEEALIIDGSEHAVNSGAVPIRIRNVYGMLGVLTVSGLAQIDDYKFALRLLMDVKEMLETEGSP